MAEEKIPNAEGACETQEGARCSRCPFSKVLASRWGNLFFLGLFATVIGRIYFSGPIADALFLSALFFGLAIIGIMTGVSDRISRWRHGMKASQAGRS